MEASLVPFENFSRIKLVFTKLFYFLFLVVKNKLWVITPQLVAIKSLIMVSLSRFGYCVRVLY